MINMVMPLSKMAVLVPGAIPSAVGLAVLAVALAAKAWMISSTCSSAVRAQARPVPAGLIAVPVKARICGTDLEITFEEAAFGTEKKIRLNREEECEHCHGTGAAEGSHPETCPDCHGTGEVRVTQNSIFGQVVNVRTCSRCHGTGQIVTNPCKYCRGTGRVKQKRVITVKIPAGVDSGSRLRVAGEGEAGMRGGRAGDLYVYLYVKSHKFFERDGTTVLCEVPISIVQAALGAEIKVPTLYGQTTIKVPEGTQPNRVLRIKGKGIPNLRTGVKGDQLIQIKVVVPTRLSDAQKEALRKFADASGESINPEEKSFFNKVKDFFDKKDKK